jgi:hypothetical protein
VKATGLKVAVGTGLRTVGAEAIVLHPALVGATGPVRVPAVGTGRRPDARHNAGADRTNATVRGGTAADRARRRGDRGGVSITDAGARRSARVPLRVTEN